MTSVLRSFHLAALLRGWCITEHWALFVLCRLYVAARILCFTVLSMEQYKLPAVRSEIENDHNSNATVVYLVR